MEERNWIASVINLGYYSFSEENVAISDRKEIRRRKLTNKTNKFVCYIFTLMDDVTPFLKLPMTIEEKNNKMSVTALIVENVKDLKSLKFRRDINTQSYYRCIPASKIALKHGASFIPAASFNSGDAGLTSPGITF